MHRSKTAGFTLIEMAMVLVIVGLLLGGLLVPLAARIDQQQVGETRASLSEIREALIGFAIAKGRLPCPADGSLAVGHASAGQEATSGSGAALVCASPNSSGVLPWATLGVAETDAWGRRYTYRVTPRFADGADGTGCPGPAAPGVSFQLCSDGNLSIFSMVSGGSSLAAGIPAIIISHGKNGFGAFTPQGTQLVVTGAGADELANTHSNNSSYVSTAASDSFDDLVAWVTPNILFNRMVAAGRLP